MVFRDSISGSVLNGLFGRARLVDLPDVEGAVAVKIGNGRGTGLETVVGGAQSLVNVVPDTVVIYRPRGLDANLSEVGGVLGVHVPMGCLDLHALCLGNQGYQVGHGQQQQYAEITSTISTSWRL